MSDEVNLNLNESKNNQDTNVINDNSVIVKNIETISIENNNCNNQNIAEEELQRRNTDEPIESEQVKPQETKTEGTEKDSEIQNSSESEKSKPSETNHTDQPDDPENEGITLTYEETDDQLLAEVNSESANNQDDNNTKDTKTEKSASESTLNKVDEEISNDNKSNMDSPEKSQSTAGRSLWVSGLSHAVRANDLKQHFSSEGRVIGAKVVTSSHHKLAKCYGYIVMSTPEEAEKCVKNLHHSTLLKRIISVQKAKSDKPSNENDKSSGEISESVQEKSESKSDNNDSKKKEIKDSKIDKNSKQSSVEKRHSLGSKRNRTPDSTKPRNSREKSSYHRNTSHEKITRRISPPIDAREKIREREKERIKRWREQKERERFEKEQKILRDQQRRQREEATRLDRERYELRVERERLEREKLELLRLEKEQLQKEKEELRRQKQKIEELSRRKCEMKDDRFEDRSSKRRHERSPVNRDRRSRDDDIPSKYKKRDDNIKDLDKHSSIKRKDIEPLMSKDSYRGDYKLDNRSEYHRSREVHKYDRYSSDKKSSSYNPNNIGMKSNDKMSKKKSDYDEPRFEPPPPCISSNEINPFNSMPGSHVNFDSTSSSGRMRNDLYMSSTNERPVDRFSSLRRGGERQLSSDNEMRHRSRMNDSDMDCFPPKNETSHPLLSRQQERSSDPFTMDTNGRYIDSQSDPYRYREQWFRENSGSIQSIKRPMLPLSSGGSHRDNWMKNSGVNSAWDSDRHFDTNIRPPGVYPNMDRGVKMDRY